MVIFSGSSSYDVASVSVSYAYESPFYGASAFDHRAYVIPFF
jgi:hypothetical protein